ncbi:MAG: putative Na+/H+ antiporter, partial [Fluviibacter sp.]
MLQTVSPMELIATTIFAVAVLHTFSTKFFARLAHVQPAHAGFWHLLSEVEVVFGFWAFIFMLVVFFFMGQSTAVEYVESRNFTEPFFVFAIMVIAASRPILKAVEAIITFLAGVLPINRPLAMYFLCLSLLPLLGSLITEPAAMTLGALMLRDSFYRYGLSRRLKYATIWVLFVSVSVGGTLTNFAAPPVLMAADAWGWSSHYMLVNFGWKAALAVFFNALFVTWYFRKEIASKGKIPELAPNQRVPMVVVLVHLAFLAGVVAFSHHPAVFLGLFLFFLGYTEAYSRYQDRLLLREALLVAFFLAGLVVLGGLQQWWLQPAISDVEP